MVKKIAMAALVAGSLLLSACNTVAGIGRDVKSVGDAVEDAAN